jgi:predicted phage terminase large subunit-like protein
MAPDEIGENTKVIMIGNLVHRDCLLAHLENKKDENKDIIKILRFPLIDENADITWEAMYPNREAVEKQKKIVYLSGEGLGPVIWAREYLLKTIDESEQIIKQTDIQYYPDEWLQRAKISSVVGVDLAISKKQTADYTAMVKIYAVYNDAGEKRYLVAPNNVKERLSFTETILKAKSLKLEMPPNNKFFVEDVAYQKSAIEVMEKNGLNVVGVRPVGDKRARLAAVSPYIKSGLVLFPKSGCSDILNEVINLGVETHDDQCDALVHAINGIIDTTSNDIFIV